MYKRNLSFKMFLFFLCLIFIFGIYFFVLLTKKYDQSFKTEKENLLLEKKQVEDTTINVFGHDIILPFNEIFTD